MTSENLPPTDTTDQTKPEPTFADLASQDPGIVREFIDFLRCNKKWWLAPILIVIVLLVFFVFLAASPAAPFIYTLF